MKRDTANFLSSFVLGHKKIVIALFSLYFLTIVLALSVVYLAKSQVDLPQGVDGIASRATAYGSQRHIFAGFGGWIVVWVDQDKKLTLSLSSDGLSWQEKQLPQISEGVENVAAAQDSKGDLHLAMETKGQIWYRKVGQDWQVSTPVKLDISGLGHRPSLIIDQESDLPAIAWSLQGKGVAARTSKVLVSRAKSEPIVLRNWCNFGASLCGIPAYVSTSGSADEFPVFGLYVPLHPLLIQKPDGSYSLFYSESTRRGETLNLVVATKNGSRWEWGKVMVQDKLGGETSKNFNLTGAVDFSTSQLVLAYTNKENMTRVVIYQSSGDKVDISPGTNFGTQISLAVDSGKVYLAYRKENGKVGLRRFDSAWSEELLESPQQGGYPLVGIGSSEKLVLVYTTLEGKVSFLSWAPTFPTPTSIPTLTPTSAETPTPTIEITVTPTPIEIVSPTVPPEPVSSPTPTSTQGE